MKSDLFGLICETDMFRYTLKPGLQYRQNLEQLAFLNCTIWSIIKFRFFLIFLMIISEGSNKGGEKVFIPLFPLPLFYHPILSPYFNQLY